MNVKDVFRTLSFGPFSNLALGMDGSGEIAPGSQGKVIEAINAGLLRLHSRFLLLEKELRIQMLTGITNYYLRSDYSQYHCPDEEKAETDCCNLTGCRPRYIMDSLDPFQNDVIKVLSVNNSLGMSLPLNDDAAPWSVFTPSVDMIQVPTVISCQALGVTYQARHPKLELGILDAVVNLPDTLEEALNHYIAYKIYSGMNGPDNSSKGQEYLALYEAVCTEVENRDLVNGSISTTNTRFDRRGFI